MEFEFRLEYCSTVHFECIIKNEVVIFLSFRKNKETKCIFVQISFHCQKFVDQHTCDRVKLPKNLRNPL